MRMGGKYVQSVLSKIDTKIFIIFEMIMVADNKIGKYDFCESNKLENSINFLKYL